jgi:hypothetical protein
MSNPARLLDEPPIPLLPSVAKALGLNEAIVIQQLHWTLKRDSVLVEGDTRWVRIDMNQWLRYFPWWSESTIRRTFKTLQDDGLVETKRGREANVYTIHYDRLAVRLTDASVRSTDDAGQVDRSPVKERGTERETEIAGAGQADPTLPGLEPPPAPAVFGDKLRIKELTPPRKRSLSKAFAAVSGDHELMKRAINGLKSYRTAHPDGSQNTGLDVIFETGPHSRSNLTEQIEWWADQASDEAMIDPTVPGVLRDRIIRRRLLVVEMYQRPDDTGARERGEQALAWLKANAKEEPVVIDGRVDSWRKVT